ncbi:MAG: class I SAM-dependent methyltransferase [Candidatus Woesearchaeota archaeon]
MNAETEFLSGLIKLQYGMKVEPRLRRLAKKVTWAKNWPQDRTSFWNAEAFMWGHKIQKERRDLIKKELSFLKGKNLDLGCGSYSYLPSVGFDLSSKMLDFNENLSKKVIGDLEHALPFKPNSFDSVTAIFVLNYVKNYPLLFTEVHRVLKDQGNFVALLSAKGVQAWHAQQQVNSFTSLIWKKNLQKSGFKVKVKIKDKLCFFFCQKATKKSPWP